MIFNPRIFESSILCEITIKDGFEELIDPPEPLPTEEPSVGQFVYTISRDDLPEIKPKPISYINVALIYIVVYNNDSVSHTLYYRMITPYTQIYGTSSVPANMYVTCMFGCYNVNEGDEIEIRLWSDSDLVDYRYKAFIMHPTRIKYWPNIKVCRIKCYDELESPILSLGNPYGHSRPSFLTSYPNKLKSWYVRKDSLTYIIPHPDYGLFRIYVGDAIARDGSCILCSGTYYPYYYRNIIPTKLLITPLKVEAR